MSTRLMVAVAIAAVMAGSVVGLQLEMVERLPNGVARMSVPEGWTPLGAAALLCSNCTSLDQDLHNISVV